MGKLISLEEVCKMLDKPETTIRRYAREHLLSPKEIKGDNMKFDEEEVKRYLEFSKRV